MRLELELDFARTTGGTRFISRTRQNAPHLTSTSPKVWSNCSYSYYPLKLHHSPQRMDIPQAATGCHFIFVPGRKIFQFPETPAAKPSRYAYTILTGVYRAIGPKPLRRIQSHIFDVCISSVIRFPDAPICAPRITPPSGTFRITKIERFANHRIPSSFYQWPMYRGRSRIGHCPDHRGGPEREPRVGGKGESNYDRTTTRRRDHTIPHLLPA